MSNLSNRYIDNTKKNNEMTALIIHINKNDIELINMQ